LHCDDLTHESEPCKTASAGGIPAIYTVIETCKANGIDPQAYIADVTANWPASRWDELLPWHWRQITEMPAAQAA
jgi:hypothetical protein